MHLRSDNIALPLGMKTLSLFTEGKFETYWCHCWEGEWFQTLCNKLFCTPVICNSLSWTKLEDWSELSVDKWVKLFMKMYHSSFWQFIHHTMSFLIGAFSSLTFKVIIDIRIYWHFKPCFPGWFFVSSLFLFFFFLVGLMISFLFYACVLFFVGFVNLLYVSDLWVALFFKYVNPFLYSLALDW